MVRRSERHGMATHCRGGVSLSFAMLREAMATNGKSWPREGLEMRSLAERCESDAFNSNASRCRGKAKFRLARQWH